MTLDNGFISIIVSVGNNNSSPAGIDSMYYEDETEKLHLFKNRERYECDFPKDLKVINSAPFDLLHLA